LAREDAEESKLLGLQRESEVDAKSRELKRVMEALGWRRAAGIGPDLVEFVVGFLEKPEIFFSMPFERQNEI
jgi:hypothetical protein